ncbi:MAG: hypothetical protein CMLOHMNK_00451 [Steroidobacteraceae bacterium]|nr:hypothetical protein [Steroidobacteraceae bacterium]
MNRIELTASSDAYKKGAAHSGDASLFLTCIDCFRLSSRCPGAVRLQDAGLSAARIRSPNRSRYIAKS